MSEPPETPARGVTETVRREERQAAALRENLRRRKQQGRLRSANDGKSAAQPPDATGNPGPDDPDR
nr:hypothetical protein [uncultured Lichenicoccus sp.]